LLCERGHIRLVLIITKKHELAVRGEVRTPDCKATKSTLRTDQSKKKPTPRRGDDLMDFLYQRMRDYCIGMISSRW
jgi:hypothetical protein